jgi:hypothetical protein
MSEPYCPRLSEATNLLPLLRTHLVAAAARHWLPGAVALDLLPIVEDGLFGYELVPDRAMRFCVTIGSNGNGVPMLRRTSYSADASNAVRLAAVNGQAISRNAPGARHAHQRDSLFPDWPSAVAAVWAQLATRLPDRPRPPVELNETVHRALDEALAIAHSHLAAWDPFIRFIGLPNEAQHGFALRGAARGHGELVWQRPELWILRWKSPPHAIYKEWSVVPGDRNAATEATELKRACPLRAIAQNGPA